MKQVGFNYKNLSLINNPADDDQYRWNLRNYPQIGQ